MGLKEKITMKMKTALFKRKEKFLFFMLRINFI
jgi:hypothetical protein